MRRPSVVLAASFLFASQLLADSTPIEVQLKRGTDGPLKTSTSSLPTRKPSPVEPTTVIVNKPIEKIAEAPAPAPTPVPASIQAPTPTPSAPSPLPSATEAPAPQAARTDAPANPCCDSTSCCLAPCCEQPDPCKLPRQAVFLFGGFATRRGLGDSLIQGFRSNTYDDRYLIGAGYQRYPWESRGFQWGWELGIAQRFSNAYTLEFFGGPTIRHRGLTIADRITVSPSVTGGFSAVTASIGEERAREANHQGDGWFLFYLGGEIDVASTAHPNVEIFYRIHHRSGASGTLGRLYEGYNASVFGVRYRY